MSKNTESVIFGPRFSSSANANLAVMARKATQKIKTFESLILCKIWKNDHDHCKKNGSRFQTPGPTPCSVEKRLTHIRLPHARQGQSLGTRRQVEPEPVVIVPLLGAVGLDGILQGPEHRGAEEEGRLTAGFG